MVMNTPYVAQQTIDDFGQPFSDYIYSATLAVNTDTTFTVVGNSPRYKALIKVTADCWVALNNSAGGPAGASFLKTSSELVQAQEHVCREVKAGDVLHFVSLSAASVSIALYSLYTTA